MVICVPEGNARLNSEGYPEDPTRLPEFYNGMYDYLKSLGMKDTNFLNACGLDEENHLTSANDIAIMSCELINKYPQVLETTKKGTWALGVRIYIL